MIPPGVEVDSAAYIAAVILSYLDLPDTPFSASPNDHRQARRLFEGGIALQLVESALLLASLRRLIRPAGLPSLPPIRSLAYFQPVIDELLAQSMPDHYVEYLRSKLNRIADKTAPAPVQKKTFSSDR
jgi:hypothetical protein